MRTLTLLMTIITFSFLSLLPFSTSAAFKIEVYTRTNLSFEVDTLDSIARRNERYSLKPTDPDLRQLIISTIEATTNLIPEKFLPDLLTVNVEEEALISRPGKVAEQIPLSLIFSTQIPQQNEIRFADYEVRNSPQAIRHIFAHETGHFLIEWIFQGSGFLKPGQTARSYWAGSIYEGTADYFSALVNQSTSGGPPGKWYSRNILQFKTLAEAQAYPINTLSAAERGLIEEGLIPRYQSYLDLINDFKKEWPPTILGDPYIEGTWLAGQLWQLNQSFGQRAVTNALINLALLGQRSRDPILFLDAVKELSAKSRVEKHNSSSIAK